MSPSKGRPQQTQRNAEMQTEAQFPRQREQKEAGRGALSQLLQENHAEEGTELVNGKVTVGTGQGSQWRLICVG